MILFIGPHVRATGANDGVTSRVMAIDSLFSAEQRVYLNISFTQYLSKEMYQENNCTIINCNYFIHFYFILKMIFRAQYIYIHTMMNYLRCLPSAIFKNNVIVDIHGVLVDELKYNKAPGWKIKLYTIIEAIIVKYSYKMICVTEQMKEYYIRKYSITVDKFIVLPIFSQNVDLQIIKDKQYDMKTVIYAGNLDKWQRVDEMLELASSHSQFNYQFLVSDLKRFQEMMKRFNFDGINIKCDSVPKDAVPGYYKKSSFGFVIRDNNILNKVSCPTKLVEYICNGVIPIMNDFQLGDFCGLEYLSVHDFNEGKIPDGDTLKNMALKNARIYTDIYNKAKESAQLLENLI